MNGIESRIKWHAVAPVFNRWTRICTDCVPLSASGVRYAVRRSSAIYYLTDARPSCYWLYPEERATVSSRKFKRKAQQEHRAWNPHPENVMAPLFGSDPFFDPEDKAQVKYEMLRRREIETAPLEVTCNEFGFTRESYRHLLERFRSEGMGGLFEHKRGRRTPLKTNDEVRRLLRIAHQEDPALSPEELARHCEQETGVALSRRTIYRVLADETGSKKKTAREEAPQQLRASYAGEGNFRVFMSNGVKPRFAAAMWAVFYSGG